MTSSVAKTSIGTGATASGGVEVLWNASARAILDAIPGEAFLVDTAFRILAVNRTLQATLPHGTPADIKRHIDWLVEQGPPVGLMLGCSSSIASGVPLENMQALLAGLAHYRAHGRGRA